MFRDMEFSWQLSGVLYGWGRWVFGFFRKNVVSLLFCVLFVVVFVLGASYVRENVSTRRVVVLVGPRGGAAQSLVSEIVEFLGSEEEVGSWDFWSRRYVLSSVVTDGYEENRELISRDRGGLVVGFAHDGFGESKNVRILLPLDRNCLHILVRREFLVGEGLVPGEVLFGDVVSRLGAGRVFVGPLGSGTRQCAGIVLEHYGVDVGLVAAHGIGDWHEMRSALNSGFIDVGFFGGPQNAGIIRKIVGDGSSCLAGLEDRDAIVRGYDQLLPDCFEANSYRHGGFCPSRVDTFGSRRVLICSAAMSDRDAFFLVDACRRALQHRIPEIQWVNVPEREVVSRDLKYPLHPAAVLARDGGAPSGWSDGVLYIIVTLLCWAGYIVIRWLNDMWDGRAAKAEPKS